MGFKLPFVKARGQAPSGGQDISELMRMMTQVDRGLQQRNEMLRQLPLDPQWAQAEFGPNFPVPSSPLDEPNAQGFVAPRIHQYPASVNLRLQRNGHIPWETLKQAAEQPLFRACIEIRKQRISTLDWCFRVSPVYAAQQARRSGKAQHEVEDDLRKQYQDEIDRLTAYWTIPDRRNGIEWADWMSQVQEELLVWDALSVYPQKTYGGDTLNFTVIDGSTIKPLLDEQGGRPMPPFPAFQQLLYGFPRGDFTADTVDIDGKLVIPGALSSSQLVYRRRTVRTWTPYGFSPTEQALLDGALWNQRFRWMMAEYTEGAQPVQYLVNKGESDWDPRQLLSYEKYLNDRLAGKTGERYRNPLLPVGVEPVKNDQSPERYKPEYDLFLIKLQAMHYGVMMTELGFTEPGGLGSAGFHEGNADIQFRKDLRDIRWFNQFVNSLSRNHLDMPAPVEFNFLGLDEEDENVQDEITDRRLHSGRITLNEARGNVGDTPLEFPEADMPMLMTQRGVVFLAGAAEAAPPGVLVEPAELQGDITEQQLQQGQQGPQRDAKVQGSPKPARPVKQAPSAADMAKELAQLSKWLAKPAEQRGDFEVWHLDPDMVGDLVKAANAAGGAGPKVSSSNGPDGSRLTPSSPYTRHSS